MGRNKFLGFILLISIFTKSCVAYKNYYYDSKGITKPKDSKFSLAKYPYQLQQNDLVRANSIYTNTFTVKYKGNIEKTEGSYLQFFDNGRIFYGIENELNNSNYTKFNKGWIGYYKMENNNGIIIETFRVHETGKYKKEYGYIKKDSLFLFKNKYNENRYPIPNENNCTIYVLKKINPIKTSPDW